MEDEAMEGLCDLIQFASAAVRSRRAEGRGRGRGRWRSTVGATTADVDVYDVQPEQERDDDELDLHQIMAIAGGSQPRTHEHRSWQQMQMCRAEKVTKRFEAKVDEQTQLRSPSDALIAAATQEYLWVLRSIGVKVFR